MFIPTKQRKSLEGRLLKGLPASVMMGWQIVGLYNSILNRAVIKTLNLKPNEESTQYLVDQCLMLFGVMKLLVAHEVI